MALLFLVVNGIPHQRLWTQWLEGAAGLFPRQQARTALLLRRVHGQGDCGASTNGSKRTRRILASPY